MRWSRLLALFDGTKLFQFRESPGPPVRVELSVCGVKDIDGGLERLYMGCTQDEKALFYRVSVGLRR